MIARETHDVSNYTSHLTAVHCSTVEPSNKGHTLGIGFCPLQRYCRYTETGILDHKQCPLDGGKFYCVLLRESFISRSPLYATVVHWLCLL